jgi:hypothetical protein
MQIKRCSNDPLKDIIDSIKRVYPNKVYKDDEDSIIRVLQLCLRERQYHVFTHVHATVEFECSLRVIYELYSNDFHITPKVHPVEKEDSGLEFIIPDEISKNEEMASVFANYTKNISKHIKQIFQLDKKIDLYYLLPGCVKTDVLVSASFLEWIKIMRMSYFSKTSNELKRISCELYDCFNKVCPLVFNKNIVKMKIDNME